jgi:hypothetical protein
LVLIQARSLTSPKRPARHVRYDRLVEKIRAEEAKLVEHLDAIVYDLTRRVREAFLFDGNLIPGADTPLSVPIDSLWRPAPIAV